MYFGMTRVKKQLSGKSSIHKTACTTNLFSKRSHCAETSHLICGAYRLTGFFTVAMSADCVF